MKRLRTTWALMFAGIGAAALAYAQAPGMDFSFERVLGTYENVDVEALPFSSGALNVQLTSPENSITLEAGSLRLEPAQDGLHKAVLDVTFLGSGRLITEVKLGAMPARFEDEVRFPLQQRTISAWVSIESVEDGYRVITKQLPETVEIELESALAGDLVSFCRSMSVFLAGDAACENLEKLLSHPKLPLPDPGSEYLVRSADLQDVERERLDLYLEGAKLMGSLTSLR